MKLHMPEVEKPVSVAIETTCRAGGVALGGGEALVEVLRFDADRRAGTQGAKVAIRYRRAVYQ